MIDRYARDAMKAVWQDQFKFETWLEVELAVCKAWAEHGQIPAEDIPLLERATFDMAHWEEAFKTTRHDVTAFLSSISRDLGPESRHIHKGLTSNDVWDTATALQLRAASNLLLEGIDKLEEAITRRAVEHKDTLMMGRTHGVHAEPTTLGLKLALWVEETRRMKQRLEQAARGVSVGKFSGAVGTHATLPPEVEETACRFLGLEVENISSQIVPRDRHAEFVSPRSPSAPPRLRNSPRRSAACSARRCLSLKNRSTPARPAHPPCRTSATRSCPSVSAALRASSAAMPSPPSKTSPSGMSGISPTPPRSASSCPTPRWPSTTSSTSPPM